MGKLDVLWHYQETDMEVSRYENEMRKDPTRSKLLRLRNFVADQQNVLQGLEESAAKAQKRMGEIEANCKEWEAAIAEGTKKLEDNAYETLEQVQEALKAGQKLFEGLRAAEKELGGIAAEANAAAKKLQEIRAQVAQARAQYTKFKEGYDKTFAQQSEKLAGLKQRRETAGKDVDPALIQRYDVIKKQYTQQPVPQPVAMLAGDQCGGCNMNLPAVVVKRVQGGESVVECENCGRILYIP